MLKFNLRMGIGAPASPIVKDGDEVKRGQKIADFDPEQLSVPIYSSVNGKVKEVTDEAIYIEKTDDNKEYL
ncbi:MAG: biotin/lipoyl-containing protein, partial [Anaerococcus sp.]|nr:biotin/lipoyl-containing protein [Anaerococcus sp.]